MSRQCFRCVLILAGALIALAPPVTSQADSGWVSPLGEIPLTNPLVTGARAAGMGFVSMAVADDGSAITSNPAALTRLNRAELSAGFRRGAFGIEGRMAGSGFKDEISGTDYASFRFAYPFPAFRGSLVLGLSAERIYNFRDSRVARYRETVEGSGDVWSVGEDYFSDGGITALSAACALDVSPIISLGATFSYLTGDYSSGDGELVGSEPERRLGHLGRHALHLVENAARLHHGHPFLRASLALSHPRLRRLLGDRLVPEDPDPDLSTALHMPRHRDAGRLDLASCEPRTGCGL